MRIKLYRDSNRPSDIAMIVNLFERGGLIVLPTDLRYVIGCHALKNQAIERLLKVKGIEDSCNQLSLICHNMSLVSEYARIDNSVFKLMKKNLPGQFTFILPALNKLPKVFSKRKEIGIRIPENPILESIAKALKYPIMVSSLPEEKDIDKEYYTNPELIEEKFGKEVELVVDGGIGHSGVTTVVNCTSNEPEIERQGTGILIL